MNSTNSNGDLRILAMAVQALIETHPDKETFKKRFLEIIDNPNTHSLYSPDVIQNHSGSLLSDLLRTASYNSRVDSAQNTEQNA